MRAVSLSILLAVLLAPAVHAQTERTRLVDVSADVLDPGESEFGIFWARYAVGLVPRLQVEADLAAYLATLVNLRLEYQFLRTEDLRMSVQAAGYWLAAGANKKIDVTVFALPAWVRATTPLGGHVDLSLGAGFRLIYLSDGTVTQQYRSLQTEMTLARYDRRGAFLVTVRAPVLRNQSLTAKDVLGAEALAASLTLDDLNAWGVLVSRDQIFRKSGHVRFGLGYRNRPGMLVIESIGRVLFELDIYWR